MNSRGIGDTYFFQLRAIRQLIFFEKMTRVALFPLKNKPIEKL